MASVRRWGGGSVPVIVNGVEASGQSYKAGDLIQTSSGKVAIATSGHIEGIALKDASGSADVAAPYEVIDLSAVYEVDYTNSAPAQTIVGTKIDATFTVGAHTWDESGATTDGFVVGFTTKAATDSKILIRFLPALIA